MKNLIDTISEITPFSALEKELIVNTFTTEQIKENANVIHLGKIIKNIYYLSSGFIKGYHLQNGKVVVSHLAEKGSFFTSLESFTKESPSTEAFQAIDKCVVYKINKSDFDRLNKEIQAFQIVSNHIRNNYLNCKMERVNDFQTLTAKQRYLKLFNQSPNIIQNVSVQDLASYLGIEPPSLSRIRKEILS